MCLNENKVSFPVPDAVSFSKEELLRWERNLRALRERLVAKGVLGDPGKRFLTKREKS